MGGLMNFDNITNIEKIDQSNYLKEITNLDMKIISGWDFVQKQKSLLDKKINLISFWGFEKSQNELEILKELVKPHLKIPFTNFEPNFLAEYLIDHSILTICLVNQGNFERFRALLDSFKKTKINLFVLEVGRTALSERSNVIGHWRLDDHSFSRTWIGYDLMILYGVLFQIGLVPDLSEEIRNIKIEVSKSLNYIGISTPSSQNPAKRLAGQMIGRWLKFVGGSITSPIAQRWSDQINKTAKQLAFAEDVNQLCFHSLSGIFYPENIIPQSLVVFLKSSINEDTVENKLDILKEELMCNGVGTDFYSIRGESRFSQIVSAILFGDFVAYYLAIANQCDPDPVVSIEI